jgi:hypothetical protein
MITLTISDEKLQDAFQSHLDNLLKTGNYDNPVKRAMDNLLGYNGELKGEFQNQVKDLTLKLIQTPEFATALGSAIAAEMAKREVDRMKK